MMGRRKRRRKRRKRRKRRRERKRRKRTRKRTRRRRKRRRKRQRKRKRRRRYVGLSRKDPKRRGQASSAFLSFFRQECGYDGWSTGSQTGPLRWE